MKPRLSSSLVATCALWLLALGAHAASAPSAVTQPADNLTTNQATLHGTANPNKKSTWVHFQYRDAATSNYTQVTAPQKIGSGGQPVAVVAAVSGLSRDTEYVFRLVATNNLGTTLGNELHFRSLPPPPIATTQPATEITSVSATLNGTVNPNASVPATAFFQWGITTNYGNTTPAQTVSGGSNAVVVSATLAGLSPETSYHFRLVATNAGGTTLGADQVWQTAPLPPVATTGLASAINTNAATLQGTVNPNASVSATVFFEWGATTNYGNTTSPQTIGGGLNGVPVTAVLAGLSPESSYHFRLVAINASGTALGADQAFQTPPLPPIATTLAATPVNGNSASLSGTVNPNASVPATAFFQWGTTTNYGNTTATETIAVGAGNVVVAAVLNSLLPETTYYFRLVATNVTGASRGADLSFRTPPLPPAASTGLATGIGTNSATLNGTVNPGASVPASAFFEWGATTNYGNATPPQTIGGGTNDVPIAVVLAGLLPEMSYHFRVVATNAGGTSFGSDQTLLTASLPVVTVCDEAHLRAAMQAGGTVTFACDGTIVLSDTLRITKDTFLDASGHSVTISGNNAVRLFEVPVGISLTLTNLTLANGRSTNGGAIFNEGTLSANLCTLVANAAVGVNGNTWPVTNATEGRGGAISSFGTAGMDRCVFVNNSAQGGNGAYDRPSTAGKGGAIYSSGPLTVSACTFQGNTVTGSKGSLSGVSSIPGGQGSGGAIHSVGSADVLACTFVSNQAHGGEGANAPVANSTGGDGIGGAISSSGALNCTNNTFQNNTAIGGMYGAAKWGPIGGSGLGGALYVVSSTTVLSYCTLAGNSAVPATTQIRLGVTPGEGIGGGVYCQTGAVARLHSSIIAYSTSGGDLAGGITDLGHNISSDGSASLTNTSSLTATDPRLGPLQDNGGPTLTMALLQASPVIGRGDPANSPATDQRGVARPQNGSSDPGAVEFVGPPPRVLQLASASYSVVEGQPELVVTVTCAGPLDGLVTVQCGTVDGTAKASLDYVTTNLVLTFASGETSKTFMVQILNDDLVEENETLQLVLSNPTGSSALDSPSNAVLTIVDKTTSSVVCSGAQLLAAASQGGEVLFGCSGTMVITNTIVVTSALTIDGRLRAVTISGDNKVRLFEVKPGGSLTLRNLVLTRGYATAGAGGAIYNGGGTVEIEMCRFETNRAVGRNAYPTGYQDMFVYPGDEGSGGAIHNQGGIVHIRAATFYFNDCIGGNGLSVYPYRKNGEQGMGGALFNAGVMSLSDVLLTANRATGGGSGYDDFIAEADGFGGAVYNVGLIALTNTTIYSNTATAGHSGSANSHRTSAWGGGFFNGAGGTAVVQNVTIANNIATATGNAVARGFNLAITNGQVELGNTLIVGAAGTTNTYGTVVDLGNNLSSDSSCAFTNTGSLNGTDPRLGPLADNGGPTMTMALLPDSPAIDAGIAMPGITTDQRGFARPFGSAPDIGAFEFGAALPPQPFRLTTPIPANGNWQLQLSGPPGNLVRLQVSTNLSTWADVATYTLSIEGFLLLPLPSTTAPQHFYRTVSP